MGHFISHQAAYSLFPRTTFIERRAMRISQWAYGPPLAHEHYARYSARGYSMSAIPQASADSELAVRILRWVGDSFTWTLPLKCLSEEEREDLSINSWLLSMRGGQVAIGSDPWRGHSSYIVADPYRVQNVFE
jgi:hypothetical protein